MKQQNKELFHKKIDLKRILKRFGIWGLLFFTAKGLVWLAIFYFGAEMLGSCN